MTCLVAGWERGCFFTMSLGTHIKGQVSLDSAHADEDDLSAVFSSASGSPSSSTVVKRQRGEELTWGSGCTTCSCSILLLMLSNNYIHMDGLKMGFKGAIAIFYVTVIAGHCKMSVMLGAEAECKH